MVFFTCNILYSSESLCSFYAAYVFDNNVLTLCQCLRYGTGQPLKPPNSLQRTFTYISLKAANYLPDLSLNSCLNSRAQNTKDTPIYTDRDFPPTSSLIPAAETFDCLYDATIDYQSFPYPTWQIFFLLFPMAQVDMTLPH